MKLEKEAYALYNDYAYRIGFNTWKSKIRYRKGTTIMHGREFSDQKRDKSKITIQMGKSTEKLIQEPIFKLEYFSIDHKKK